MDEKEYQVPSQDDGAAETAETPTADIPEQAEAPCVPLSWQFGDRPAEKTCEKARAGRFYGVFAAFVALSLALLILLLFVGQAGLKIYRTVTNERTVYIRDGVDGNLLTPEEAAAAVRASTVTISVKRADAQGLGSGFVYTADGYVCTNYHVVESAVEVQVVLPSGIAYDAKVVGGDQAADVAVLKIEATGLIPAKIGNSDTLLVGEDVLVVGTPHSMDYRGTATFGKISYTNRLLSLKNSDGSVAQKLSVIQTDAPVNNGNSGGPLANMYGEVIGMVVRKQTYTNSGTPAENIGFALPVNGVKIIVNAIIATGEFTGENPIAFGRTLLGVTGRGLKGGYWYSDPKSDQLIESPTQVEGYFEMPCDGVYVVSVSGQTAVGKIKSGDIIVKINGLRMYTIYDVIGEVNRYRGGQTATVTVLRSNSNGYTEHTVEILLLEE